jgi:hypothetical protein
MSVFAVATKPTPIANRNFRLLSYALGVWSMGLAIAQMVSFEDFVQALGQYRLGSERGTVTIAIVLLTLEVFSVPFLFRMSLSRAARYVSALFTAVLPYAWAALTVNVLLNNTTVDNAGYFGGFLELHVGGFVLFLDLLWAVVVAVTFGAIGGKKALRGKD